MLHTRLLLSRLRPALLATAGLLTLAASAAATPSAPTLTGATQVGTSVNVPVKGTAPGAVNVSIYKTANCTGPVVTNTRASFEGTGIVVTVDPNVTTTFAATATDGTGTSGCSAPLAFTHDDIAPVPPTVQPEPSPVGPSSNPSPKIYGTGEAGSTIKIYASNTCGGSAVGSGQADTFPTLGIGATATPNFTTTFYARAVDAAGNASACSATGAPYVHDSVPPLGSTISSITLVAGTTVRAVGTAPEPNLVVRLYTTNTCTPVSLASTGTTASFAAPGLAAQVAPLASTTLAVVTVDAAGNASACSGARTFVHGTPVAITPGPPTATTPITPASQISPLVRGTADASAVTVNIYDNNNCLPPAIGSGTAADYASPGIAATVSANTATTLYAQAVDAGPYTSACSVAGSTYVHDDIAPTIPSLDALTNPASPARDLAPKISGFAELGSTVRIFTNATCTGLPTLTTPAATFNGAGQALAVSADTSTTFSINAADAVGNTSACSTTTTTYVNDRIAPPAPPLIAISPASPSQFPSPSITGTAEAGSTVQLFTNATCTGLPLTSGPAATFAGSGLSVAAPQNTTTNFAAKAVDAAGNASLCGSSLSYRHDDTPPLAPSLNPLTAPVSPSSTDTPRVRGTAEAGSIVRIYRSAGCSNATLVGIPSAAASFASPGIEVLAPLNATTTFYAEATDVAGNVSACSPTGVAYRHDDIAPAAPTLSPVTSPRSPSGSTLLPHVSGNADGGTTVRFYPDSSCSEDPLTTARPATELAGAGVAVPALANAQSTFYAQATDTAGNVSACSTDVVRFTHDGVAPAAPTPRPGAETTGTSAALSITVRGEAEADSTVELYNNATCSGDPVQSGTAAQFAAPGFTAAVLESVTTTFTALAVDVVGNVSACGTIRTFTQNTPAPPQVGGTGPGSSTIIVLPANPILTTPKNPKPTQCANRRLTLLSVGRTISDRVRVAGVAAERFVGKSVLITGSTGQTKRAEVFDDGTFETTLPIPKGKKAEKVRYRAQLGAVRTPSLRLNRRFVVARSTAGATAVRVLTKTDLDPQKIKIQISRDRDCTRRVKMGQSLVSASGTLTSVLSRPKEGMALYRLSVLQDGKVISAALPIAVRSDR